MNSARTPVIAMIAAMAKDRVIGANNAMPWHLPADLQHFKRITLGKPVIMGRKTYESIGKALPGRHNIVVSRQQDYRLPDADVVATVEQGLQFAAREGQPEEIMIIGGGTLYSTMLPKADKLYLTFIDLDAKGDTFFPDFQDQGDWSVLSEVSHQPDEKNPFAYTFTCLARQSR